jgi:NADPH:quinone reductase-like Zn-dependent oxidoreductase
VARQASYAARSSARRGAAVSAGTDLVAAATLPLGGLTSAQALDIAAVETGHTLLVLCDPGALPAVAGVRRNPAVAGS